MLFPFPSSSSHLSHFLRDMRSHLPTGLATETMEDLLNRGCRGVPLLCSTGNWSQSVLGAEGPLS